MAHEHISRVFVFSAPSRTSGTIVNEHSQPLILQQQPVCGSMCLLSLMAFSSPSPQEHLPELVLLKAAAEAAAESAAEGC